MKSMDFSWFRSFKATVTGLLVRVLPSMDTQTGYPYRSLALYESVYRTYAQLYETQPNIRTCVDFLARNVAQLGWHVFRRVNDVDRQRLINHPLAKLIDMPNAWNTRYRFIESLMSDIGIYHNAFWLKIRQNGEIRSLLRIPPDMVVVRGSLIPQEYEVNFGRQVMTFLASDIVHFRGYNPSSPIVG